MFCVCSEINWRLSSTPEYIFEMSKNWQTFGIQTTSPLRKAQRSKDNNEKRGGSAFVGKLLSHRNYSEYINYKLWIINHKYIVRNFNGHPSKQWNIYSPANLYNQNDNQVIENKVQVTKKCMETLACKNSCMIRQSAVQLYYYKVENLVHNNIFSAGREHSSFFVLSNSNISIFSPNVCLLSNANASFQKLFHCLLLAWRLRLPFDWMVALTACCTPQYPICAQCEALLSSHTYTPHA